MRIISLALALFWLASCSATPSLSRLQSGDPKDLRQKKFYPTPIVIGGIDLADNPNAILGYPRGGKAVKGEIIISRKQYMLSWNGVTREVNWATWLLQSGDIGSVGRAGKFAVDPDLNALGDEMPAIKAVGPKEYTASCFDRGHQVPSGDRTDSAINNQQTFYMSNMVPQTAYLNRVRWEHLEKHERQLAEDGGRVMIFAGPIFNEQSATIGPNSDIAVPVAEFKIIVPLDAEQFKVKEGAEVIAVIMPNLTSRQTDPIEDRETACQDSKSTTPSMGSPDDWMEYRTTISEIESQSGLDFQNVGITR